MAAEMKFVCSCTLFLALQAIVVLSKDDSGLTGCSYFSSAEYLQRPGSLRDRLNELPGSKKGLFRQSWKTSVDESQQNNAQQDGDEHSPDVGWSSPNQKIWGKRGFGSEIGELERRNMKLCENEKRKWGRNNQKVWGKREETLLVEPYHTKQVIFGDGTLNYGSGEGLTDGDRSLQTDDKMFETDSDIWGDDDSDISGAGKRAWGQNKAKVWGKRGVLEEDKRKWGQNKAMVWGKREESTAEDKRKWGQNKAMVWGKRDELLNDEDKRKWGPNKAMVWGKRDDLLTDEEKRKWGQNKAMVWGKRDELVNDEDKRIWGQSKAMVWGKRDELLHDEEKRKWGQSKAMVWGKRDGLITDEEKRKWGQNKAKVWGKRDIPEVQHEVLNAMEPFIQDLNGEVKRKWGDNKAKVWGKRDTQLEEKRRWGKNTAKVWGKRDESEEEKRLWGDNKAKVWGKREDIEEDKRKWGGNKAKVWGKRSEYTKEKRTWGSNKARVWGKRHEQEDASLKPITKVTHVVMKNSEDRLEEEKRKWAQNKAKVWGKRDVSAVSEKEILTRMEVSGNQSADAKVEKISQRDSLRNFLKHNEDGIPNLLDKITGQITPKKMCILDKAMVPCPEEERNDGQPNYNKDLPDKHHVIDDVARRSDDSMTSPVKSDSIAML